MCVFIRYTQVDTDKAVDLAVEMSVDVVPTFLFLKHGTTFDRIEGVNVARVVASKPLTKVVVVFC